MAKRRITKLTYSSFLALETRLANLCSMRSALGEREAERRYKEIKKEACVRLRLTENELEAILDGKDGRETVISVFTKEEMEAFCAPSEADETARKEIEMTVAQIKDLCSQLPFPSRIEPGGASSTYSEWFITKLYRRNRSSGDCSEYQTERDRNLSAPSRNFRRTSWSSGCSRLV